MTKRTTIEEREAIVNKYQQGIPTTELSKEFGISVKAVCGLLERRGIERRKQSVAQRKFSINESFFDKIDTQEKAYVLGILFADGCNYTPQNLIRLSLNEKDKEILEKISKAMEYNKPLRYVKTGANSENQYSIDIYSKHMSRTLYKLGCIDRKTEYIKFPVYLAKNLYPHFIRGYFDGDGYIGIYKHEARFCIVGTKSFCLYIQAYFKEQLDVNSHLRKRHKERSTTVRMLEISGNKQIKKVLDFLYSDANLYLKRKYDKYREIDKMIESLHSYRTCSICDNKHYGKGFCRKHYYSMCGGKKKRRERYLQHKQ